MTRPISRRRFLGTSAAVAAAGVLLNTQTTTNSVFAQSEEAKNFKTKMFKAVICGDPTDAVLGPIAKNSFDGVETTLWNTTPEQASMAREFADKHGLRIHSVMRGWASFNSDDDAARQKSIDETATAIRAAAAYGADTILLVPCRIGGMAMPAPWDFQIDFDPETLMVNKVVEGDNEKYKDYIDAQNKSTKMSIEAINGLVPLAAELGVVIAVENVWNNLWVKPEFFAAFVRSFDNIWVRTYLDLGNHAKYAASEEWVMACGSTIIKTHCKDFIVDKNSGSGGSFEKLYEGSINWPAVRRCLDEVNYNGWMSDETGAATDEELARRMDAIIVGKKYETKK